MIPAPLNGHRGAVPAAVNGRNAAAEPVQLSEGQFAIFELMRVARLLLRRAIPIILITVAVAGYVAIRDKYYSVKWYRAQALITPVSPDATLASSVGEGATPGAGGASGLAEMFNLSGESDNVSISERYIAIMSSYAFTTDLINCYHLDRKIVKTAAGHVPNLSPWQMYQAITGRFKTDYDYRSGNLTLYFVDPSPALAKSALEDYLASLRDKVRSEEVQAAAAAVVSLQDEIRDTSDALLQNQLYELMARQIQREKIAQVQADFAFKVIEPPVVPDNYFAPMARRNATVAGMLTFILLCAATLAWDFVSRARAQIAAFERAPFPAPLMAVQSPPPLDAAERSESEPPPPSPGG
ncbi:MAG TPA: hypothetical protein VMV27_10825 [Candidatus Binataceae bacterium]|nr:hypothetical protein [Candidatus Binataceae bacterium]